MGKKYLETKKGTLESSILGVWKTAIEEGDARMDGRTKDYKEHRKKLESARSRREDKRVNKEEVEIDEKVEYVEYLFKNKNDASKAKEYFAAQQMMDFDINDDALSKGELTIDAGKEDMSKHHKEIMKKFKPKVLTQEEPVNPKDREELDKAPSDTAKKMKRAKDPAPNQMTEAQSGDKEAYKKFFDAALKKFKVSSPAELKDDQKKKFYDYIDKNWEGDNEKAEGAMSQVREFKMQSMKAALAQVWGMEEGKNPFAEHKGTKPHKHPHDEEHDEENEKRTKTETGKKPAAIDLKPKIDDK